MVKFTYVNELSHPRFRNPDILVEEIDHEAIYVSGLPFWQEQLYYQGEKSVEPWRMDSKKACRKLAKHMTALLETIEHDLKSHEKPADILVQDALGLFISTLFWSNQQPVQLNNLSDQLELLELKPLNLSERLDYCLGRAQTFLGFRQLNELMLEQRKLIAKYR